ncbi:reverse transcriptase domain-containing protein [Tanacetum coccineum]|uniref:Reverse transcriptase domain-containing protein n=1 Tax=Tanacetum coccineum TaxID=301880 RepID=A0ABQ5ACY0_9ASTR
MAKSTVIEEQDPTWMTPIIEFISKGTLPHEQKDARRIRRTAQRFELRNGVLYRRSWIILQRMASDASKSLRPSPAPTTTGATPHHLTPWPFPQDMGIDIAGPFPVAAGGLKFLIVAIDYFTKWIEARAVATITENHL